LRRFIDSGASRCIYHSDFATHLGIDLTQCPVEITLGIGGSESLYLHDLTLYIPGVKAGFKERLPVAGVLGMMGFFEHFRVMFDGGAQTCSLERIYKA
jgi:hypothetical protein